MRQSKQAPAEARRSGQLASRADRARILAPRLFRPVPSDNARSAVLAPSVAHPERARAKPGARQRDVLAAELAQGRISQAAFRAGRMVEATLERARRGNVGSAWPACGRIDLSPVHDAATLHGLDQAKRSTELIGSMVQIVGPDGAGLLRAILHKGLSFTDYAARCGGSGERAASRSAQQFRSLLERLAEHWPALSCE